MSVRIIALILGCSMALGPWRLNGTNTLIVDATGAPIWCEDCPCADCYDDLIDAIIERQGPTERTPWTLPITKTLQECIDEVNIMAPWFISGTYAGGLPLPTNPTTSYADAAADFCELYTLVKALLTTQPRVGYDEAPWLTGVYNQQWQGAGTYKSSTAIAYSTALADFHHLSSGAGSPTRTYNFMTTESGARYTDAGIRSGSLVRVSYVWRHLGKSGRTYIKPGVPVFVGLPSIFDKQNSTIPDEGVWGLQSTDYMAAEGGNHWYSSLITGAPENTWVPNWTLDYVQGFQISNAGLLVLFDWDFVHVPTP